MYIYTHIYTYIYTHTHIHTYMYIYPIGSDSLENPDQHKDNNTLPFSFSEKFYFASVCDQL